MIRNNEIYVIRGKELKGLISLLVDLKSVAIEYAKTNESEIEETELVYRILKLAGINLKAQEIVQVGQTLEQGQISQEKK